MKAKTIGERLQVLRNEYGLTSEKLAALAGMTRVTIDNIEKGLSNPYRRNVETLASKLGSTYEWLQDGKGEMLPNGKIELSSETMGLSINPYRDYLIQKMEGEIAFYRQLLSQMAGGKGGGNFLRFINNLTAPQPKRLARAS